MLPEDRTAFPEDLPILYAILRAHRRGVSARRQPCVFPGSDAGRVLWERVAGRWE